MKSNDSEELLEIGNISQKEPISSNISKSNEDSHKKSNAYSSISKISYLWNNPIFRIIYPQKLGLITGVIGIGFLNIFGAILFLRFGTIVGNAGSVWTLIMLFLIYFMNIMTLLSLSAIATNGKLTGGGAYFVISRVLGPELGSSIGIMIFIANVFSSVLDIIGLVDFLKFNYPAMRFNFDTFVYGSGILFILTMIALLGSRIYTRISLFFVILVLSSLILIIISLCFQTPVIGGDRYTGFSWNTFVDNLQPVSGSWFNFTMLRKMYGLLIPGTSGFLAGFTMSSDLKNPNRDIPRGSIFISFSTLLVYLVLLPFMVFTISKQGLLSDYNILGNVSLFYPLHFSGVVISTLSASFMSFIGGVRVACISGKDRVIPFISWLGIVVGRTKEPVFAVFFTWFVCQIILFIGNLDIIASYVSLSFILMYFLANISCLLLSVSLVPNFRPSFRIYSRWTCILGCLSCLFSMFFIDPLIATGSFLILSGLMLSVYFFAPAKSWGNISKSIIYYQTRKYILKMDDRFENVKYWRFKPLILCSNPRSCFNMLWFFTEVSKHRGGLAICGHVDTSDFRLNIKRHEKETEDYFKLFKAADIIMYPSRIHSSSIREGVRNLISSGVSFLQSNTLVIGFHDDVIPHQRLFNTGTKKGRKIQKALSAFPSLRSTNSKQLDLDEYMEMIKDCLLLKKNIVIARNFQKLSEINLKPQSFWERLLNIKCKNIDVWMLCLNENNDEIESTISLMLQIAFLMRRSGSWKKYHKLRIHVIIDQNSNPKEEKKRVSHLLQIARVKANLNIIQLSEKDFDVWINPNTEKLLHSHDNIDFDGSYISEISENSDISETKKPSAPSNRIQMRKSLTYGNLSTLEHSFEINLSKLTSKDDMIKNNKIRSSTSYHFNPLNMVNNNSLKSKNFQSKIKLPKSKTVEFIPKTISIGEIQMTFPATVTLQRSDGTFLSEPEKYKVLNNVIKKYCNNTSAVLISMPPPPPIFNQSVHKEYHTSMKMLTDGLPASMMIYSSEKTINTLLE